MYLRIAGNITAAVTEDCAYLIVIWSPVDKAQQYYVRVRETGVGIDTATVDDNMYKTSLSSERVKELSIEVYHISTICNNVDFVISQVSAVLDKSQDTQKYSDPITINTKGLHNPTNFEHCVIIVFSRIVYEGRSRVRATGANHNDSFQHWSGTHLPCHCSGCLLPDQHNLSLGGLL